MEFDTTLIMIGILMLVWAIAGLAAYVTTERGSLLDPITISWAGHILFIGGGLIMTGLFRPERGRDDVAFTCASFMIVGTLFYTVGLYLGKQKGLANLIPRPRAALSDGEIWFMWVASTVAFLGSFGLLQVAGGSGIEALINPLKGIIDGSMGAAALLSVMVIFGYRGRVGTKIIMAATLIGTCTLIFLWSWSRRPLVGVLVAAGAYFYRVKISKKGPGPRTLFLATLAVGAIILMLFLGATRGRRFHGAAGGEYEVFSWQNFADFASGITINYEVAEFAYLRIPSDHPYLMGSGFVPAFTFLIPRAIWPEKPVSTGFLLTTLWYGTEKPENNLAQTIVAEWYANFGYFGVPVGMMIIGIMVRTLNTYVRKEEDNKVLWPAWLLILPDFATEWRGDFTSMTVQAFLRVALFVMLAWVASKVAGGRNRVPRVSSMAPRGLPPEVARAIRATRRPRALGP